MQDAPSVDQNQPEITPPAPSATPPKKRNFGKVVILCIVLVVIILGIAAASPLFFSPKGDKAKIGNDASALDNPLVMQLAEKMPIPKITIVPITLAPVTTSPQPGSSSDVAVEPTSTPAMPQEWKTYTNSSLKFSLSYPSELSVQEKSLGFGVWDISFVKNADQSADDYKLLIYPNTVGKLIGLDFDMLNGLPLSSTQRITTQEGSAQQFTKTSSKTISGLQSFEFRTTSDPPDPNAEAENVVYIQLEGSTLIISTRESNKAVLNHMMSTFKFPSS